MGMERRGQARSLRSLRLTVEKTSDCRLLRSFDSRCSLDEVAVEGDTRVPERVPLLLPPIGVLLLEKRLLAIHLAKKLPLERLLLLRGLTLLDVARKGLHLSLQLCNVRVLKSRQLRVGASER